MVDADAVQMLPLSHAARIDHIVHAMPAGQLQPWVLFQRAVLGLLPQRKMVLHDPYGVIRSRSPFHPFSTSTLKTQGGAHLMALDKPYLDVPGTTIFDVEQSRKGYHLNQFCMSLIRADNRARFKAGERAYLDEWAMTEAQKQAVLARDLNWCIRLGGNIYFLAKIGATDGRSFQQMAGSMTGMTEDEYRNMMVGGGRSVEGNRFVGEDGDAQAHHQPQGSAGRVASTTGAACAPGAALAMHQPTGDAPTQETSMNTADHSQNSQDIGKTIHPHPTLGESIGLAAEVFEGHCTDLPPQKKK